MQKHFYSQTIALPSPRSLTTAASTEDWVDACLQTGFRGRRRPRRGQAAICRAATAEYAVLITHYALQPMENVIQEPRAVPMTHVKPELDALTEYDQQPV